MRIIPAIDIINGKCVRLSKGDYATEKVYNENPLEVAKMFEDHGIKHLHLVDLDGAKASHIVNYKVLENIASNTNLAIDFGGGLKSDEDLKIAFESGANQITGGSIAVKNPEIFKRVDSKLQLTGGANISLPDQQKNTSEIKIKIEKIEHFMREKEPFMDSTISLASLSESLDMETKELSYIINQELRTHFFDFINSYRINKAKELLADSSKEQLTVSEIMYDVGFNSKSSFFTCFKKSENQTPTEFRKAHHSKIN